MTAPKSAEASLDVTGHDLCRWSNRIRLQGFLRSFPPADYPERSSYEGKTVTGRPVWIRFDHRQRSWPVTLGPFLGGTQELANYGPWIHNNGSELQHWILRWFDTWRAINGLTSDGLSVRSNDAHAACGVHSPIDQCRVRWFSTPTFSWPLFAPNAALHTSWSGPSDGPTVDVQWSERNVPAHRDYPHVRRQAHRIRCRRRCVGARIPGIVDSLRLCLKQCGSG